ncbi:ulp1 protease family, C-terminal catalytic domain-containing protein [Artemisia annua]|uniref:Ulp1 protease family, C-terminal catalytic domain-containing protein n=1 Tax=Artemisia annua TaxID=35608 RepID=A0A2U1Q029_ARTAN|nr:ulp1 protease family, C-terminal catalytic domain-containing protein [Artemisia annua]
MGLKMTAMMVNGQVAKVDCIKVQCEDDLFGHHSYTYINWNDFDSLFSMDELSGAVVASYIMYLYEQIKNGSQRDHGVCFMTSTAIMHHERKERAKNIEEASRVIAKRLPTRKQNDLILLPYNPGRHWVLGVLNMKTSTCYYLDSLSVSDVNHQFKQIVDAVIHKKKGKKKRQIEPDNEEEVMMPKTVAVEKGKSTETLAYIAKVTEKGNPLKKMMTRGQKRVRKRIEKRMGLKMTAMMVDGQVAKVDCIKVLFSMDELSRAVVASYIMYLYEQIKNGSQRDHGVCFMTPTAIMHHERKERAKNIEEASRVIAKRLPTWKQNDLILLPYNPGRHWVLGVLNMKTSTCYYLDSLSVSDVNHQFKQIVDAATALYDVEAGTNKRTKLNWVNSNIGGDSNEYTDADFDDIREEWAIYVSNFIFK